MDIEHGSYQAESNNEVEAGFVVSGWHADIKQVVTE